MVAVVVTRVAAAVRTRNILKTEARRLSLVADVPADLVYLECLEHRWTPGDWAMRNGLDPITYEPRYQLEGIECVRYAWE